MKQKKNENAKTCSGTFPFRIFNWGAYMSCGYFRHSAFEKLTEVASVEEPA